MITNTWLVLILIITISISITPVFSQGTPLEQFKSGITLDKITCKAGYELIIKAGTWYPACVKPSTAYRLIEIGWALNTTQHEEIIQFAKPDDSNGNKCSSITFPIDWSGCNLYGKVLTNIDLRYANLRNVNLLGTTLSNKDLTRADFTSATLTNGNLDGAILHGAIFTNAHLFNTKVRGADLTNTDFRFAKLYRADFTGSTFTNSDLSNSTLTRAILAFANLQGANLEGAGTRTTNLNHCYNHPICD